MAERKYLDYCIDAFSNYQSEGIDKIIKLYRSPAALSKTKECGLLTVVDSQENYEADIDGILLCRKTYNEEDKAKFLMESEKFMFILRYQYCFEQLYDDREVRSNDKTEYICPELWELVIKDGELFGFYYCFSPNGRQDMEQENIPEMHLEGIFTPEGNWYGYSHIKLHESDSFSDPSYYDNEEQLSLMLGRKIEESNNPLPLEGRHISA